MQTLTSSCSRLIPHQRSARCISGAATLLPRRVERVQLLRKDAVALRDSVALRSYGSGAGTLVY